MGKVSSIGILISVFYSLHAAEAKGVVCQKVQEDTIELDGYIEDWDMQSASTYREGEDSLSVSCSYTLSTLFLAVRAHDSNVVRTKKGNKRKDDFLEFSIGVGKESPISFLAFPGNKKTAGKQSKKPRFVEFEESLQKGGFSMEVSIPLKHMKDWSETVPYLEGRIVYSQKKSSAKRGKAITGWNGKMHFSDAAATYRQFMQTVGLKNKDVKLDKLVHVDAGDGPKRVIVGGRMIGILGSNFSYMELPIATSADLLQAKVVDFDNSGRHGILTLLRQQGNGGSRDILVVWFYEGGGKFTSGIKIEVRKERDGSFFENQWVLEKKNNKVKIHLKTGEVQGFTKENYREAPATDAKAILLPWSSDTEAEYFFEGVDAYGGIKAGS